MYIREAYRLLQKSIIFVETQDIELEDNAEVFTYILIVYIVYIIEYIAMVP